MGDIANATADAELGITNEMIDAGADVILGEVGGADLGGLFSARELAKRVYLAMLPLDPRAHSESQK